MSSGQIAKIQRAREREREGITIMVGSTNVPYSKKHKSICMGKGVNLLNLINTNI